MHLLRIFLGLTSLTLAVLAAKGQSSPPINNGGYPYLLHLETMNFDEQQCVLLQRNGHFHLEDEKGNRTRIYEGTLSDQQVAEIEEMVNSPGLAELTQKSIPRPAGNIILNELHLDIFRGDHWQQLFFPDNSTRKPFEHSIAPLVRWLESLHKEPHAEISEDAGKNNCQLPKPIVLKTRKRPSENTTPQP